MPGPQTCQSSVCSAIPTELNKVISSALETPGRFSRDDVAQLLMHVALADGAVGDRQEHVSRLLQRSGDAVHE